MMTPELKVACEVVFQEHKNPQHSVTWNRDAFRGRLSTGLTEMAKDTLLRKKIIYYPNPSKRMVTLLSPQAEYAASFEEAEKMVSNGVSVLMPARQEIVSEPAPAIADHDHIYVSTRISKPVIAQRFAATVTNSPINTAIAKDPVIVSDIKWYMKPVFYYFIWPVCAAAAAVVIAHFMGALYTELFFDLK